MSRRNPTNDRYTTGQKGKTRRSAQTAKPKAKAASSVQVQRVEKTQKEKKAIQKADREKEAQLDREAYKVPTPEYKRLRRIYYALLIPGVVLLAAVVLVQLLQPEIGPLSLVLIGIAYAAVIGALVFDRLKIGKLRKAYRAELSSKKKKAGKA